MNKSNTRTQNKKAEEATTNPPKSSPMTVLHDLLTATCTRYTVISLIAILVNLLLSGKEDAYISPLRFLLILPFAFLLAAATLVRRADKLSTGAKVALHPILSLGGFYLCIYLPFQLAAAHTGTQFVLLLLAALVYGIIMAVITIIARRTRRKQEEKIPYVSQFSSK